MLGRNKERRRKIDMEMVFFPIHRGFLGEVIFKYSAKGSEENSHENRMRNNPG
jgi:hypothetical protein